MWTIALKEASSFFSSLAGLIISGVFLLVMGLMLFFFPDTSILSGNYANMDGLFYLAPTIFTFVIPAITMRFFAEELQTGTIELLATKPISDFKIIMGKFLAVIPDCFVSHTYSCLLLYGISIGISKRQSGYRWHHGILRWVVFFIGEFSFYRYICQCADT